jgi:hypothetical protein
MSLRKPLCPLRLCGELINHSPQSRRERGVGAESY